jgi:hypothetical protein
MSRDRRYPGIDLTYSQAHRDELGWQYDRGNGIGHRTKMIDRDWTEYCHWCMTPLALIEEVRIISDRQFADKQTKVTRVTAERARLPGFLVGWRTARPWDVQAQIDKLNTEVRDLEAAYPIVSFRARHLWPVLSPSVDLEPPEWWEWLYLLHRDHHHACIRARRYEFPVRYDLMCDTFARHKLNLQPGMIPMLGSLIQLPAGFPQSLSAQRGDGKP